MQWCSHAHPLLQISAVAMGVYCFDVLKQYLFRTPPVPVPEFTNEKFPLFVTWTVPSCHGNENGRELRGCIGTFRAVHLGQGLHDYVLNSAFKDHRFPPITKEEFGLLECEVSLLTKFEIAANYHDWTIGQHGIWISFTDQKGVKYTSTYLPQVMSERGWTKDQAIDSLLRKGGFNQPITSAVRNNIILTRYEAEKIKLNYATYLKHKNVVIC